MATVGFRTRHYLCAFSPSQIIKITCSPIFPSLQECQADARHQFVRFLIYYLHHSQSGVYHSEMDLDKRGLISAYVFRRKFYGRVRMESCPLSEFVIEAVMLLDESEAPQIRHEQAEASSGRADLIYETLGAGSMASYASSV
jgi:hypothetical protein